MSEKRLLKPRSPVARIEHGDGAAPEPLSPSRLTHEPENRALFNPLPKPTYHTLVLALKFENIKRTLHSIQSP